MRIVVAVFTAKHRIIARRKRNGTQRLPRSRVSTLFYFLVSKSEYRQEGKTVPKFSLRTGSIDISQILAAVDTEVAAIKAVSDNLPDAGALTSLLADVSTVVAAVDTEVASIKAITDALPDSGALTTLLGDLATVVAAVDTEVASIKGVTDVLPDAGALTSLLSDITTIKEAVDTEVAAIKSTVDTNLDAPISGISSEGATKWRFVAADTLNPHGDDTEYETASESYVELVAELFDPSESASIEADPELRVRFDLRKLSPYSGDAYGRVYEDGVAVGTERITSSGSYVTYSEDIAGWDVGDEVRIYAMREVGSNESNRAKIRNFRITVDIQGSYPEPAWA